MTVHTGTALVAFDGERAIREAVSGIARSYGPDYYRQQVDDDGNCAELLNALGATDIWGSICPKGMAAVASVCANWRS